MFISASISGNAFAGEKGWLGVQLGAQEQFKVSAAWRWLGRFTGRGDGVFVREVIAGSPAEQMGIKQNDVILSANYKDIKNPNEFTDAVSALNPGDKIVLLIFRMSPTLLTIEGTMGQSSISAETVPTQRRGERMARQSPGSAETEQIPKPAKKDQPVSTDVSARIFASTGHHEVSSVAFSPDGKQIISGGNMKNSLKLWDIATGREIRAFIGDADTIYSVAFSPDGRYVLSGSANHTMKLWDLTTAKEIRAFTGHTKDELIHSVAFSPDGRHVLSGGSDKTLKLWDLATGREIRTFSGHAGWVSTVAFSPDGRYALSGSWDNTLALWDISTGKEIRTFTGRTGRVSTETVTKDGDPIPAAVRIFDKLSMGMSSFAGRLSSVAFSPDGRYALSGTWGGTLTLWDISTGKEIRAFTGHKDRVNSVAFSPDGRNVISSARDNSIKLWDVATGREIRTFTGHRGDISSVAFSRDVKSFISGGADGTVRRWDTNTGKEIAQFVSLKDGEWIVITPEGYYNSSLNGHKYLNIRVGNKVYGIDQFYDVFYRPDIVAAKLRGDDISSLITITIDDALKNPPPTVEFASVPSATDQPKVKVCYQVKSTGGGIGEVRLFHNGKLIESDGFYRDIAKLTTEKTQLAALNSKAIHEDMRGVIMKSKADTTPIVSKSKGEFFEDCKEVESVSGENEVSVTAFNTSNTVQSYMKTANFNANIKGEESHLYILSIGIDQYKDSNVNLKYAVKDARDMTQKLLRQSATLFRPQHIHQEMFIDKDATKANVLNKINEISRKVRPADSFVLFVAGHGILLQNQYYMLTSEYDGNVNEVTMISSNEIVEMSKKIKSLSQLFIFDTCHAGGVDYIVSGLYDARMSVLAKKMGLHIYASANSKEAAMDGYQGNGLFTYTLIDGLNNKKEADKNKDSKISLVELGEYSKQTTTEISKKIGHQQTPVIINFGKDNQVYLLR
ncbi:MAG: caspase family protein [Thermodesulfobacteriota bacterium]|nr:caspase family protein [Thermodesulfobacteriota bacterium]